MTKAELVTQVALKTELTKQQSAEVVDLLLECIIEALQAKHGQGLLYISSELT